MNTEITSLWSSLRTLPRPVWILFLGTFLNKFGTFVVPFLSLYLTRRGFSISDAGLAVAAYGTGHLAASVLGGYFADTLGRRRTIVLSMFSGGATMLLLSQARQFPTILALTALAGLTGELYRPAGTALLADLTPPEQRLTVFAAYRLAFNAGWAFGPATAGFLAGRGYLWLFAGDASTSIIYGLVAFWALPRALPPHKEETERGFSFQLIAADRRLQRVLIPALGISLIFFQFSSTFGLQVTSLGLSGAVYGAILSLNGAMICLCELPLTTITRRFAPGRAMAAGYALVGIGAALIAAARSVPELAGCMALMTLGEMITMPICGAYVADLAPPHLRGRYMGSYSLTWSMGLMLGPMGGMRLFGICPALVWLVCGGIGIGAAAMACGVERPDISRERHRSVQGTASNVEGRMQNAK